MICGTCGDEAKFLTQVRTKQRAICPKCGQRDTIDEAVRIANDSLTGPLIEDLDKSGRKSGGGRAGKRPRAANKQAHKWRFIEI